MKILISMLFSILLSGTSALADRPAVHGMLVFGGEKNTFASHLPMFHALHDRQVILKIAFENVSGSHALQAYLAAKGSGKTLFTIEPEKMDLEPVANGDRTQFTAAI